MRFPITPMLLCESKHVKYDPTDVIANLHEKSVLMLNSFVIILIGCCFFWCVLFRFHFGKRNESEIENQRNECAEPNL